MNHLRETAHTTQKEQALHPKRRHIWYAMACLCLLACADTTETPASNMGGGAALVDMAVADMTEVDNMDTMVQTDEFVWPETPPEPERPSCIPLPVPIVLAHGFLGAGDTWSPHRRRFTANGFCGDRIHPFDWNSLDRNADHVSNLTAFIEAIKTTHQVEAVDLVGHSAGGGLGYEYLADVSRAQNVRRYIHIGSFPSEGPAGPEGAEPIPTLNLWSERDLIVEGADIPGATNIMLTDEDHYEIATSAASFEAMYTFLMDESPSETDMGTQPSSIVSGRYLTFGENQPVAGGGVEAWVIDENTGQRLRPAQRLQADEQGYWGPLIADGANRYELVGTNPDARATLVRHFFESFTGDNALAYLRGFPGPGSLAGVLVNLLPKNDTHATLVIYNARGAFLTERDSLTLNGEQVLNEDTASEEDTTIAFFVYDIDNDGERGGRSPVFDMFPFLTAIDFPIPVDPEDGLELNFNGRLITVPKAPSNAGILVAVFD